MDQKLLRGVDCGNSDVRGLEFDHRDPKEKKFNICKMVCGGVALKTLAAKITKCDVRCANCHRTLTMGESHCYLKFKNAKQPENSLPRKLEIFHRKTGLLSNEFLLGVLGCGERI